MNKAHTCTQQKSKAFYKVTEVSVCTADTCKQYKEQ